MPQASATSSLAAAIWKSPAVSFNGTIRCLRADSRFQKTFPDAAASGIAPLYRLREQLLNELVYHLHSYGARPGYVSFREIKSKVLQLAAAVPKPVRPAPPVGGSQNTRRLKWRTEPLRWIASPSSRRVTWIASQCWPRDRPNEAAASPVCRSVRRSEFDMPRAKPFRHPGAGYALDGKTHAGTPSTSNRGIGPASRNPGHDR